MSTEAPTYSERVVVVAPTRRDGQVTCDILRPAAIECDIAHDLSSAAGLIEDGIGALVLTDIAFVQSGMPLVLKALAEQPQWSNLPVIALCREAGQSAVALRTLQVFRNATVLERPISARTLLSAVRSALRGRR